MVRWVAALVSVVIGSLIAHAQVVVSPTLGGLGAPGGAVNTLQYNATGTFAGIPNSIPGNCLTYATPPVWGSCAAGSQTSIAAGSNITTSGSASNVTVNAIVSPSGSSGQLQYNNSSAFAGVSGATSNGSNVSFTTNSLVVNNQAISGVSGNTGTLATISGTLGSGHCLQFDAFGNAVDSGSATCGGLTSNTSIAAGTNITTSGTAGNVSVAVVNNPTFSGNLTGSTAQFSGLLTGTTVQAQTVTVGSLGASTQCLESIAGVLTGFGSGCGGTATSIAAGSNITTSGTANNITINVVATPSFTTMIASGNITAATAQFAGFLTAGGASLSGLTIQTETLSGALIGTTANFSGNLTGTTAQFSSAVTGTTATFQTVTAQNFTSVAQGLAPSSAGGTTNFLRADATWAQPPGTASPTTITIGGTNGQVEYNLNGNLGANASLTAGTTGTLNAGIYASTPTGAGALSFFSPSIAVFALAGTATPAAGWINWGGEARLTTTRSLFNSATLTPTVLSVNLQSGRTYAVDADLYFNTAAGVSGIQASLTGTYGSTATNYFGYVVDGGTAVGTFGTLNPVRGAAISAAKNGVVGNTMLSGTTGYLKITGNITASSSGTLVVAAGQNAAGTTATTLTIGSRLIVHDMP